MSNASGDISVERSKRFEVKKWNAVALWEYCTSNDVCSICRHELLTEDISKCPECENTSKPCEHVVGVCNHRFHKHCISRWVKSNATCPMDMGPWKEKTPEVRK